MDMNESPLQKPLSCTGCKGTLFGVVGYCPFCGVHQPESVAETDPKLEIAFPPDIVADMVEVVDLGQNSEAGPVAGADPDVNSEQDEESGQDEGADWDADSDLDEEPGQDQGRGQNQERSPSQSVRRRRRQKLSSPPTTVPTPGQGQGADRTPVAYQTQTADEPPVVYQAQVAETTQVVADSPVVSQTQAAHRTQTVGEDLRPVPFHLQPRYVAVAAVVVLVVLAFSFLLLRSRNADGLVSRYGQAEQAFNNKDIVTAKIHLDEFLRLVPNDKRGLALRVRIEDLQRRHAALYEEAKTLAGKRGGAPAAAKRLTVIVNEDVSNRAAQTLLQSLAQGGQAGRPDCQSYEDQVDLALEQKDFIKAQHLANAARAGRCSQASALNARVKREGEAVPLWVRENTSFAFEELTRAKNQITSGKNQEGRRMAEAVIEIYGRDAEVFQEAQNVLSMAR